QWQAGEARLEEIKKQEAYWLKEFEDDIPVIHLPIDHPRPVIQSFEGNMVDLLLTPKETHKVKTVAEETDTTLFMTLLALFNVLLSKLSGQEDMVIGIPVSGRRHADLERIIGMFVNTLAIRSKPGGRKTFEQYLEEIKTTTIDAFQHQEYPFEDLVEKLEIKRDTGRNPLYDIAFNLMPGEKTGSDSQEKETREKKTFIHRKAASKMDLTLTVYDQGDTLLCSFEYCTRLFEPATIEGFIGSLKEMLSTLPEAVKQPLSQLEIITEAEKHLILKQFNETAADYPKNKTIHRLFEDRAEKMPHRIALVGRDPGNSTGEHIHLSYGELNRLAGRTAHRLQQKGVEPGTIVPILAERTISLFTGIMGILKTGSAYLPIAPEYPEERVKYMLDDCGAQTLVIDNAMKNRIQNKKEELEVIQLNKEEKPGTGPPRERETAPQTPGQPSNLSYIIYTSGSTGRPKGVMVEHRSLVNTCTWIARYFQITPKDHTTQFASPGFDASVMETFPSLLQGANLHIVPEELKLDPGALNRYYETHDINFGFLPSALYHRFMKYENHSLRALHVGGEKIDKYIPRNYNVYNNYGPTEDTIITTSYHVDKAYENIPVGKPINNNRVYMMAPEELRLRPIGVTGELCIAGDGLARGYLNNPELTAEKFTPVTPTKDNPAPISETTIYRTGDLARWLPDGNIQYLGRIDQQVKIRGFRIELGEIQHYIETHPQVKEAAVINRDDSGRQYLCAYIVTTGTNETGTETGTDLVTRLKKFLEEKLPGYMVPATIM
ncbi:MAG: amino acid adenylation domain-containing protein, partial [bacterium]|nr:amino acid adenylation domain-containing protein [bacterium]